MMEFEDVTDESSGKKFAFIILIFIIIAAILIVVFLISVFSKQPICGDGSCNGNENKCICPQDCGTCNGTCGTCMEYSCKDNKCLCSKVENCCGNGICERGEDEWSCCIDCNCSINGMVCNTSSLSCEVPKSNITEEEALEIAMDYLNLTDTSNYKIEISNTIYNNETAKMVCFYKKSKIVIGTCLIIDKNKNVVSQLSM